MADGQNIENPRDAAVDPATDAETLRRLAYYHPELRPQIAAHPNAYQGLLDWMAGFGDPQVAAAIAARSAGPEVVDAPTTEAPVPVEEDEGQSTRTMASIDEGFDEPAPATEVVPVDPGPVQRTSIFANRPRSTYDPAATAYVQPAATPVSAPEQRPLGYAPQTVGAAETPERERSGASRALKWVLGGLIVIAVVLVVAVVLVFTGALGSSDHDANPMSTATPTAGTDEQTEDPQESPTPTPTEEEEAYPAPDSARQMASFVAPSGNVSCVLEKDRALCKILEADWKSNGYETCDNQSGGVLVVTETSAKKTCDTGDVGHGGTLNYGEYAVNGDYACSSTQDGFSCWNTKTGYSFALARGGWMTGHNGEITPNQFSW